MTSRLLRLGLATSLFAWSGILLAEGPGQLADDVGVSTPRHHPPRRKTPKKKGRTKQPKGGQPDAEAAGSPVASSDGGADAGVPATARVPARPSRATGDEDEEDDEDEDPRPAGTEGDAGSPRRPRKERADAGGDAGTDDEDEEENEDDETAYELGVELAAESRLVWRGLAESRGAVLQSSGWAGIYGFSVEGWASYILNSEGSFDPMTVVGADVTASYVLSLGPLRLGPGVTLLYFPEGLSSSTTAEASFGASYRLGEFRLVSGTNIDLKLEPGAYFGTFGVSWGRARPPWSVKGIFDVGWATAKYNYEYLGKDVTALDVVHAGVSARYDLGSVFYVDLHVDVSTLVAPTLSGGVHEPLLIVGGAAAGIDWSLPR
jgi:hypothetical protein